MERKKSLALLLALVLVALSVTAYFAVKPQHRTLVVPTDYPNIQAAVDAANAGDTVLVLDGTHHFYEVDIDKSIRLLGQNSNLTVLDGLRVDDHSYPVPYQQTALNIEAPNVVISGFTITDCFQAISANNFSATIENNNIYNSWVGITTEETASGNTVISNNNLVNDTESIDFYEAQGSISNNRIIGCGTGILVSETKNVIVNFNQEFNSTFGLNLADVSNVDVYGNSFENNSYPSQAGVMSGYGVEFELDCNKVSVYDNCIAENWYGFYSPNQLLRYGDNTVSQGSDDIVYRNNFDNHHNVFLNPQYPYPEAFQQLQSTYRNYAGDINGTAIVSWDKDNVGNYWSDYSGTGAYVINEDNVDWNPLTHQVNIPTLAAQGVNFSSLLPICVIAGTLVLLSAVVVLLRRRRQPTRLSQ